MKLVPLRWQLAGLLALILALLWSGALWIVARDTDQTEAIEKVRLLSLSRAFSEHALASIQRVDSLLLTLRPLWESGPQEFARELARHESTLAGFALLVGVVDRNGMNVFNNLTGASKPVFSGDTHHYLAQKESEKDQLIISPPRLGRITKKWFVQMSRRIEDGGRFDGLIYVSANPEYYGQFYNSLALGEDSTVAMIRDTGEFVTRHPFSDEIMGMKISGTPFLGKGAPVQGNFQRIAQTDGVARMFGFTRLPEYGLTLVVARPIDVALAPVTGRKHIIYGVAAGMSLLLLLLVAMIYRGMAAREQAEAAVRNLNAELEERVRQRTVQLEQANKELEAFAYSVAHDLKAPLRGISGYSSLLASKYADRLGEEAAGYLRKVQRGSMQMNELITDLLAYAQIERGALQPVAVELRALVEMLLEERDAGGVAEGPCASNLVPVMTVLLDRGGLTLALRNLIDNAVKFTRASPSPSIEVGARDQGASVLMWVKDNGTGFNMAYHDRIFDMFQRLNRSEDYPGTGIGLAIVRKAVERMQGRVWADSAPGKGATFYLDIPR